MTGQTVAIARRILLELLRQRRGLVFWAVFPVLMLLLFGAIYGNNPAMRGAFEAAPAGILIGAALFFSGLGGTVSIVVGERERRTLRRLLVSPLHPAAYFLGIALALGVVAAGQAVLVAAIAAAQGMPMRGSWTLATVIVALSVVGYVGMGFFFGARFAQRAEDINGPISAFGVPLLVLGGTFFPLELMPPWLRTLAWFDPVLHMNEALKGVTARGLGAGELGVHLACLGAFAAVALVLGVASFRRLLVDERHA